MVNSYIYRLLDNQEFKHQFINTYCDRINTTYSTDHTSYLIDSLKAVVAPYVVDHINRYGPSPYDSYTPNTLAAYNAAVQRMYDFASYRPDNARNEMVELFDLNGATNTISLFVNDSEAGHIKINTLNVNEQGWMGEYFSDIPISIKLSLSLDTNFHIGRINLLSLIVLTYFLIEYDNDSTFF